MNWSRSIFYSPGIQKPILPESVNLLVIRMKDIHSNGILFWMKNAVIMISVSVLSAYGLKMEAIFVLQQISQKRNFPLRK